MQIPTGSIDRHIYFVALDATDLKTRETGLDTWTVYGARNGEAAVGWTTPTITEVDGTNLPGVYELLVDEDTTLDAGHDSEELVLHITHAGMHPVTRVVTLYRPKLTEGQALQHAQFVKRTGTAQDGTGTTIQLDAGASAIDDIYTNDLLVIVSGTGAGQSRFITAYDGTTKDATVATWGTNPDNTSVFTIIPGGAIPVSAPSAADIRTEIDSNSTQLASISGLVTSIWSWLKLFRIRRR